MIKLYINKKGDFYKTEYLNNKKTTQKTVKKSTKKLPFIGTKRIKDKRTVVTISKNGHLKIYTKFKNGGSARYSGKFQKGLIPESTNGAPLHGWEIHKNKVCQGYRSYWKCSKLY